MLYGDSGSPTVIPTSPGIVDFVISASDETGARASWSCSFDVHDGVGPGFGAPCAADNDCDDGDPCNGEETCNANNRCVAGTAPDCDDGDACTTDTCDAGAASGCVNTDVACANGETCIGGVCVDTCVSAADCDDSDPCTDDACVDAVCNNTAKDCDDGLFCTGTETCNADTGACDSSGDPCVFGVACNEGSDTCGLVWPCVDDVDCDDGVFCNGVETCDFTDPNNGVCALGISPCAQGQGCIENTDSCGICSNSGDCDDGVFCNGIESCIGGTCFSGQDPCAGTNCSGLETVCEEGTTTAYCSCLQVEGDVIVVEEETSLILESLDQDSLTFSYAGQPPNIQVGDILMGTQGGGYLRGVSSIDYGNNTITVTTVQSAMDEVVQGGSFSTSISMTPSGENQRSAQAGVRVINANGLIDLTGLRLLDTPNLVVDVTSGSVQFSPDVDVNIDFGFFRIDSFEAAAAGTLDFNLDVRAVAFAADSQSFELQLASYSQGFVAGPVAGVVTLSFSAGVEVSASVAGDIEGGFSTNHYVRAGARYEDHDWSIISERSSSFDPHEPVWNLGGTAYVRVYVEPKVEVFFYGVAGPSIDIEPYLRLDGSFEPTCEWELSAGIIADANFRVGFLSYTLAEFTAELFDYNVPIGSGQCSAPIPDSDQLFAWTGQYWGSDTSSYCLDAYAEEEIPLQPTTGGDGEVRVLIVEGELMFLPDFEDAEAFGSFPISADGSFVIPFDESQEPFICTSCSYQGQIDPINSPPTTIFMSTVCPSTEVSCCNVTVEYILTRIE